MSALHRLSIGEASEAIGRGTLSPVELVESFVRRIEALDPTWRAFRTFTPERAIAQAREREAELAAGRSHGPLHGIPLALKDIYDTAGVLTTYGSALCADHVPGRDAGAWRQLAAAGAVLLGKLETHEFANGGPRRVSPAPYDLTALNPWNPKRYVGGSSSGSAVAVAARLCMGALGSDTGGSIRIPASYCGVVGLKPTYGLVSRTGVFPVSHALDHCGPLTWTVEDAAFLVDALAGYDPDDPASLQADPPRCIATLRDGIAGRRLGYARTWTEEIAAQPEVGHALEAALGVLQGLGAEIVEVSLPCLADITACNTVIVLAEAHAVHQQSLRAHADQYSEFTRDRLTLGACVAAADYVQAQRVRRKLRDAMHTGLTGIDALIAPMTASTAPDAEQAVSSYQKFFYLERPVPATAGTLLGMPSISQCCGFAGDGMPIAMQLLAEPGADSLLLRVAHAYEQATPWRDRLPVA